MYSICMNACSFQQIPNYLPQILKSIVFKILALIQEISADQKNWRRENLNFYSPSKMPPPIKKNFLGMLRIYWLIIYVHTYFSPPFLCRILLSWSTERYPYNGAAFMLGYYRKVFFLFPLILTWLLYKQVLKTFLLN